MARAASLELSRWLPSYAWWPHPDEFSLTVVLSTHHATVDAQAEFRAFLRGYAGSSEPLWTHDVGALRQGEELAVELEKFDLPPPPESAGGILEVHVIRLDRPPTRSVDWVGMWVHAEGREGGGYLIPTIPMRGQEKKVLRDDLQVIPGVMSSPEVETELVLLNPIDAATKVQLTVSSAEGLVLSGGWFTIEPWSAWRSSLSNELPRVRRLLAQDGGVGSAAVYSTHKLLPYFGFRRPGRPLSSMDHAAPIFA